MEFLTNWWFLIIIAIVVIFIAVIAIIRMIRLPKEERNKKIREWLLYAVTMAEKELGAGTGAIKLRYVYDMFLKQFPLLSKFISFDKFSEYVDTALEKFKHLMDTNTNISEYIEK